MNILSIIVIIFLYFKCFNFFLYNFDITDEGFALYNIISSNSLNSSNLSLYILNKIGYLWNQDVYSWRIFTLIWVTTISLLTTIVTTNFVFKYWNIKINKSETLLIYLIGIIISFSVFTWHPTLDYNILNITLSQVWLIFACKYVSSSKLKNDFLYISVISLISFLVFFLKFPFGLILMFFNLSIIYFKKNKLADTDSFTLLIVFVIFSLLTYFFNYDFIVDMFIINSIASSGSHEIPLLLRKYFDDFVHFFNCNFIHPTLLIILFYNNSKVILDKFCQFKFLNSFIILSFFSYLLHLYLSNSNLNYLVEKSHNRFMMGFIISCITIILIKHKYLINKNLLFFFILLIVIQLHSIGTNTILLNISSISIVPLSIFLVCLFKVINLNRINIIFVILITSIYSHDILKMYQKINYRRNLDYTHQNTVSIKSKTLKNLYIEKDLANTIDSLIENLIKLNFDFNNDYIFGYPDIPGLLVGINCKSLGSSWKISGYSDSKKKITHDTIQSLNNLKINDKVFLIIDEDTVKDDNIISIIENRLSRSNNFKEVFSGEFFHHRNKKLFKCKIIGPYIKS